MKISNFKFQISKLFTKLFNFKFLILNSRPSRTGGFTLLEVMIALAVTGGLLVTLIYTLNYHLGIAERHEIVTIASILAKDKIAEIEKSPVDTKGEFPEPYSDYHYVTAIRETPYPGISEISVTVSNGKEKVKLIELMQSAK